MDANYENGSDSKASREDSPITQTKESVKKTAEEIDEAYSSEPWWYDIRGFLILTFAYRTTLLSQVKLFGSKLGSKHLEIAIGTGTLFDLVLKWRKWKRLPKVEIVGFDYATQMLAGAKKRFRSHPEVSLVRADAGNLQFSENTFDTANIANAIHCLPEIEKSLKETHRVLKPGGLLIGNCLLEPRSNSLLDNISRKINVWGIKKGILNKTYSQEEVSQYLNSSGFKIIFSEIKGNCFNFIAQKSPEL